MDNYTFSLLCPEKQHKNSVNFSSNFHPNRIKIELICLVRLWPLAWPRIFVLILEPHAELIGPSSMREYTNSARLFTPGKRIKLDGNTAVVFAQVQV